MWHNATAAFPSAGPKPVRDPHDEPQVVHANQVQSTDLHGLVPENPRTASLKLGSDARGGLASDHVWP